MKILQTSVLITAALVQVASVCAAPNRLPATCEFRRLVKFEAMDAAFYTHHLSALVTQLRATDAKGFSKADLETAQQVGIALVKMTADGDVGNPGSVNNDPFYTARENVVCCLTFFFESFKKANASASKRELAFTSSLRVLEALINASDKDVNAWGLARSFYIPGAITDIYKMAVELGKENNASFVKFFTKAVVAFVKATSDPRSIQGHWDGKIIELIALLNKLPRALKAIARQYLPKAAIRLANARNYLANAEAHGEIAQLAPAVEKVAAFITH